MQSPGSNVVRMCALALSLFTVATAGAQTGTRAPIQTPRASGPGTTLPAKITPTQGGVWTPLVNPVPEGIDLMMLLTDGTVAANGNDDNTWYRLTPDSKGSYVNGTWSQMPSMEYQRLYMQSQILTNGNLYVSGGEYGNAPAGSAELYNPVANTWTELPNATTLDSNLNFVDGESMLLPNGKVLAYAVSGTNCVYTDFYIGDMTIYDPVANSWSATGCPLGEPDETSWVKLPDNSILGLDLSGPTSERYIPATGRWIADAPTPVNLFNVNGELGGAFLLPNGKVLYIGGTNQTLIYTPSGNTNPGTWVQGPTLPDEAGVAIGANDAPAAMMVNGNVIMSEAPYACGYCGPTYFFVYNYQTNTIMPIDAPDGTASLADAPFVMDMLDLPDGSVLFSPSGSQLYTFTPGGGQLKQVADRPVIKGVKKNTDGSYTVTGTGFNGISGGADYGDENQNATNYPIARLTDSLGNVYYARTYNWSSTGVKTGSKPVTTQMAVPAGVPAGNYQLAISANGISSTGSMLFHYQP